MEQEIKPYIFLHNDHDFYFKTTGPLFRKQCLRINRLTSKCEVLTEELFQEETIKISKHCEEACLIVGIITVLEEPYLCIVDSCQHVGTFMDDKVYRIQNVRFIPFRYKFLYASTDQGDCEKILQGIRSEIINDNFYFCYLQDITLTYDKKTMNPTMPTARKYFWNESLLSIFARHKLPLCWRIPIMQGYVREIHYSNPRSQFYYLSISRRSKHMSGTRFHSRGIDHNFNTANYVETEEIFMYLNLVFSFVTIRGSVPIFWEQSGFGADIRFSKEKEEDNETVIKKHYQFLKQEYNCDIVTVNLLSKTKPPEKDLKSRFQFYYYKYVKGSYIHFDLNEEVKGDPNGHKQVEGFVKSNQELLVPGKNFFCMDRNKKLIICRQRSLVRVNCLDCLDRTNATMARISEANLLQLFEFVNASTKSEEKKLKFTIEFERSLLEVWGELGNQISKIYSGTESTASHLTKKQQSGFMAYISSGLKSITRYYNANNYDSSKQEYLDYFLCNKEEKSSSIPYFEDNITSEVLEEKTYCTYEEFKVLVITWNCNMVDPEEFTPKDAARLFNFDRNDVDIVVICLQEMVELNSYNVILGNNETVVGVWKNALWKHLNSHDTRIAEGKPHSETRFDYLTGYDLVGISTFVFSNFKLTNRIENIVWHQVKTGFKGSLGNKGIILLFMTIDSTRVTIMNCHLAAGESKSDQRLQDLEYLHFEALKDRKIRRCFDLSEFRFFAGDFNFRMEGKSEDVLRLLYTIEKQDQQSKLKKEERIQMLRPLMQKDQFNMNRQSRVLSSYNEGEIYFLPTYKFIKKTSDYDTKRTPAWCDRILYYRKNKLNLIQLKYEDIDVYISDHKPVRGVFSIRCKKEDHDRKKKLIEAYFTG